MNSRIILFYVFLMGSMGSVMLIDPAKMDSAFELSWSEDFNGNSVNPDNWTLAIGDGCPGLCGFGNKEKQFYTDEKENVRIEDGKLVIEAHRKTMGESEYTSAKLFTQNKFESKWGKVEVRAKLPYGTGTWPAIWMLPTISDRAMKWPDDGEIDIMEHVGYNPGMIYGTIHTKKYNGMIGTQKFDSIYVADAHEEFHTYSIEWTADHITWLVDGDQYAKFSKNDDDTDGWPFNQHNYHLIINLAVGGNWGGRYGVDKKIWPQRMEVDFIRYYKLKN